VDHHHRAWIDRLYTRDIKIFAVSARKLDIARDNNISVKKKPQ
jgi:hypothetical protein